MIQAQLLHGYEWQIVVVTLKFINFINCISRNWIQKHDGTQTDKAVIMGKKDNTLVKEYPKTPILPQPHPVMAKSNTTETLLKVYIDIYCKT